MRLSFERILLYSKRIMELLNLLAIFVANSLILYTFNWVAGRGMLRRFMEDVSITPFRPNTTVLLSLVFLFIMLVLLNMEKNVFVATVEIFCCLGAILCSYLIYNGLLLLVIADITESIKLRKNQVIFTTWMSVLYLGTNYNIITLHIRMLSLEEIIHMYPAKMQSAIIAGSSILNSINLIVFIVYMILLIRNQVNEKEKIRALNDELTEANLKLKDYARLQKELGETEERNRIAREIHDTLGHTMTGLSAGLDACETLIDFSIPETKKHIRILSDVAREGLIEIRRSVNKLRPSVFDHNSLEDAIHKIISEMQQVSDARIRYVNDYGKLQFSDDEEEVIYRLVQEGITNAIRHGKATAVLIQIYKDGEDCVIRIKDNGIGCEDIQPGFGIYHMKERLDLIHGKLELDGSDGFEIIAHIAPRKGEKND